MRQSVHRHNNQRLSRALACPLARVWASRPQTRLRRFRQAIITTMPSPGTRSSRTATAQQLLHHQYTQRLSPTTWSTNTPSPVRMDTNTIPTTTTPGTTRTRTMAQRRHLAVLGALVLAGLSTQPGGGWHRADGACTSCSSLVSPSPWAITLFTRALTGNLPTNRSA